MKILFLDQSGKLGGAELCLLDIAKPYKDSCLVGLFADGSFKELLQQHNIPVQILTTQSIQVRKESTFLQSLGSISSIAPLIAQVARLARDYDVIYTNTQKALIVGALASVLTRRPLVYHLHDILSTDHFSSTNRYLAVTVANRCASLVIANSQATQAAFIAAGGRADMTHVVYNGFDIRNYQQHQLHSEQVCNQLGLAGKFLVGHFSRLSPWKGQHILLAALAQCPENVVAIFVGDALFGEEDYVQQIHQQVTELQLEKRVKFLGFRSDVIPLMNACDLVTHTSIAPEPFGRVIVEAMLCGRPVVAAQAGGAVELVETGKTGWLVPPGEPTQLASVIVSCLNQPEKTAAIAYQGQLAANQRFDLQVIEQQLTQLLNQVNIK
ncbi:glycosyltransferase family 4 protein [Gloeocapsopsis sp. IPPAS B-1203]|uniref:glycosyltransferase family 4 protein n=1 Tax=Gloeocapsopsis sp. IPPAS B-1203 TaxID=2049454 RepID=UPI000C19E983|nr:glycosyltransferase family 4 protein [Gloeocapsopsis sp. IPPAS B-1203]PIG94084.1 glycosyl transferase family 1 [Gloeocapsopsis sp. IPPAS B-1203]